MGIDDFGEEFEESYVDTRVEEAKEEILKLLEKVPVVTDRELKVRLEKQFFPWVTGRALSVLLDSEIEKHGYAGRRRIGVQSTDSFYSLRGTPYDSIKDIIEKKRRISGDIVALLTGTARASTHAEDLFLEAFQKLNFTIHGRDVSEFQGRKAPQFPGKEPSNLDFVVERDSLNYGVDIKNWLRYEADTREEVEKKVRIARILGTIPFILARYIDEDTIYTEVLPEKCNYGITYRYESLFIPPSFASLAVEANSLMGYNILAVDCLPDYKVKWIEGLHQTRLKLKGN